MWYSRQIDRYVFLKTHFHQNWTALNIPVVAACLVKILQDPHLSIHLFCNSWKMFDRLWRICCFYQLQNTFKLSVAKIRLCWKNRFGYRADKECLQMKSYTLSPRKQRHERGIAGISLKHINETSGALVVWRLLTKYIVPDIIVLVKRKLESKKLFECNSRTDLLNFAIGNEERL